MIECLAPAIAMRLVSCQCFVLLADVVPHEQILLPVPIQSTWLGPMDELDKVQRLAKIRQSLKGVSRYSVEPERKHTVAYLKSICERNRVTLVLGAGVSKSVGLPLWGTLLSELLKKVCGDVVATADVEVLVSYFARDGSNPLVVARHIEGIVGFRSTLLQLMRECMGVSEFLCARRSETFPRRRSALATNRPARWESRCSYYATPCVKRSS